MRDGELNIVRIATAATLVLVCATQTGCPSISRPDDGGTESGASDVANENAPLTDFEVHTTYNLAGPLADAAVRIEWPDGRFEEGTTNADGVVHFSIDFTRGPFDVTAWRDGYSASSVVGVDGPLRGPLHLVRRLALEDTGVVSGTISMQTRPDDIVIIGGDQVFGNARAMDGMFRISRSLHPEDAAGFHETDQLFAFEIAQDGTLVNVGISPPISGREMSVSNVAIPLPSPPRTITTVTRPIDWPDHGVLSEASMPAPSGGLLARMSDDRAWAVPSGVLRGTPPRGGRSEVWFQYASDDPMLVPNAIGPGYTINGRVPVRAFFTWRDPAERSPMMLPVVLAFEIAGTSADTVRVTAAAEASTALRLLLVNDATRPPVWIVNQYDPSRSLDIHVPHLPAGTRLADIAEGSLGALAILGLGDATVRAEFPGPPSPVELFVGPTPIDPGDR